MLLQSKTALITGGATGIGLGIAKLFLQQGCKVGLCGRRDSALQAAVTELKPAGTAQTWVCDVADRAAVDQVFQKAQSALGQIDILVNAAGINIVRRTMADLDPTDWDQLMAVNATGAYNCMRAVLPAMRTRKDGIIINISSISGKRASMLGGVAYSASKFAMTALGNTAALEDGKYGIRVTNIFPGEVETPILDFRPTPVSAEHRARILQPEDVAQAALLVATLPARAHIPELIIKPTSADYA